MYTRIASSSRTLRTRNSQNIQRLSSIRRYASTGPSRTTPSSVKSAVSSSSNSSPPPVVPAGTTSTTSSTTTSSSSSPNFQDARGNTGGSSAPLIALGIAALAGGAGYYYYATMKNEDNKGDWKMIMKPLLPSSSSSSSSTPPITTAASSSKGNSNTGKEKSSDQKAAPLKPSDSSSPASSSSSSKAPGVTQSKKEKKDTTKVPSPSTVGTVLPTVDHSQVEMEALSLAKSLVAQERTEALTRTVDRVVVNATEPLHPSEPTLTSPTTIDNNASVTSTHSESLNRPSSAHPKDTQTENSHQALPQIPISATGHNVVDAAIADSHAQVLQTVTQVLRNDIESGLISDISQLDEKGLRARIVHLTDELRDRSRWEAVRLAEFLESNEKLWLRKLEDFILAQAKAFDEATANATESTKRTLESEYALRLAEASRKIKEEADNITNQKVQQVQDTVTYQSGKQAEERLNKLTELGAKIKALEQDLSKRAQVERSAAQVQRITLATLALGRALEVPHAVTEEIAALQVVANGDAIINKAIAILPQQAHSRQGVPSRYVLQSQFANVARNGRRAALTKENTVFGTAVGTAKAVIVLPATRVAEEAKAAALDMRDNTMALLQVPITAATTVYERAKSLTNYVSSLVSSNPNNEKTTTTAVKASTTTDSTTPSIASTASNTFATAANTISSNPAAGTVLEAGRRVVEVANEVTTETSRVGTLFDAAEHAVAKGDLDTAVRLLSGLSGHAANVVEDWVTNAKARIEADRAIRLLQARASVLSASYY